MKTHKTHPMVFGLGALLTGTFLLATDGTVRADEFYPPHVALRTFGTNQGNVGDCQSEAEVGALEQAFAARGLAVKLSLFHRHAYNWKDQPAKQPGASLALDAADLALLNKTGGIAPDYMWPEDTEGFDPSRTGTRPHPAQAMAWEPDFPAAETFGFNPQFVTFKQGFANSGNFESLKIAVAAGRAVTLSIHAPVIGWNPQFAPLHWDRKTGMLETKYSMEAITEAIHNEDATLTFATGTNHAVAVVGFDDSLYADQGYGVPGAFLVRNSWNDENEMDAIKAPATAAQEVDLKKMRLRLFPMNLPGYYAIPYAYVNDLVAQQSGGYQLLNLDFVSYAAKYQEISNRYEIVNAPFACDAIEFGTFRQADPARRVLKRFAKDWDTIGNAASTPDQASEAKRDIYVVSLNEVASRNIEFGGPSAFQFAKVAREKTRNVDRAADLYAGTFNDYYCANPGSVSALWPTAAEYQDADYQAALDDLSISPRAFPHWIAYFKALTKVK